MTKDSAPDALHLTKRSNVDWWDANWNPAALNCLMYIPDNEDRADYIRKDLHYSTVQDYRDKIEALEKKIDDLQAGEMTVEQALSIIFK